jgi:hypothetical protein
VQRLAARFSTINPATRACRGRRKAGEPLFSVKIGSYKGFPPRFLVVKEQGNDGAIRLCEKCIAALAVEVAREGLILSISKEEVA